MHSVNVNAIEMFQALSDKTRLRLMRLLVSEPREEACLCEFSDSLREPEYNLSRHLKVLRQTGLLSAIKEGRWVYHRLVHTESVQPFYALVAQLDDADGSFSEDIKRFRAEIKRRSTSRCIKDGPELNGSRLKKRSK